MKVEEISQLVRCGACHGPLGERPNMIQLTKRATWKYPASGNLVTGYGPCAVAILCDACAEACHPILEAVEFNGQEAVYHPLAELDDLGPEPTHTFVVHARSGDPGIRCMVCGHVSADADDVANLYCPTCERFHPIGA